jgi:phage antirepressor YoqD-like protein
MLTINHPNTFLFLIKKLCILLKIDFLTEKELNDFLENNNYINL